MKHLRALVLGGGRSGKEKGTHYHMHFARNPHLGYQTTCAEKKNIEVPLWIIRSYLPTIWFESLLKHTCSFMNAWYIGRMIVYFC